ncbi:hypothetical protein [Teredinibacter franksiae]|uniref:hypothetical protein n=1 Tax=Teredinibacter franksiae TaxID=2761453 RepID=UPI0016258ACE|nr:hypothetical protein [Teredinibacter franksiae]
MQNFNTFESLRKKYRTRPSPTTWSAEKETAVVRLDIPLRAFLFLTHLSNNQHGDRVRGFARGKGQFFEQQRVHGWQ